ncbi:MAG TPA: response regulator [Planctomycetaceae bacterium]|nr:response regulator [Planctomycetaceae bacterium]
MCGPGPWTLLKRFAKRSKRPRAPKILIVDDSLMIRMVIRKTLASLGAVDVVEAENGQVALQAFSANEIGLVFSDWNMP